MRTFYPFLLRTSRGSTALYALGMGAYALLIVAFYSSFRDQSAALDEILKTYPESVLRAFGLAGDLSIGQLADYLSSEVYSFVWMIVALVLALVAGSGALAADLESGTLSFWLATGLSRASYLVARWLSFAVQLILLVVGTALGVALGLVAQDVAVPWAALWAVSLHGFIFAALVYALVCACSTLFSERGAAARMAIGLVFLSYLQWIVGGLWQDGEWLARFSLFSLFDALPLLRSGEVDVAKAAAGTAVAVALLVFALWRARERDLALG